MDDPDSHAEGMTVTPKGAESGERMGVRIEEGKRRIFESIKAGKHKKGCPRID